jgi:hypothetical protein
MSLKILFLGIFPLILTLSGCTSRSRPQVKPPGEDKTASLKTLETGARMLQSNAPVAKMDVYMVGFHPMKDHPSHQMEAHHFCKEVNEEFSQCALFDGNTKDANLNGIEYIISENLFNELPEAEKKYWHPHNYEILSGQLIAPGLPDAAEKAFIKKKINSYGKTWHVWNTGHHGEALPGLEKKTEEKFGVKFKDKREYRKDLVKDTRPQRGVDVLSKHYAGNIQSIEGVEDSQQAQEEPLQGAGKGPVIKECREDIEKFCSDKDHGQGDVRECLIRHKVKVSEKCKKALETTGFKMGGKGKGRNSK